MTTQAPGTQAAPANQAPPPANVAPPAAPPPVEKPAAEPPPVEPGKLDAAKKAIERAKADANRNRQLVAQQNTTAAAIAAQKAEVERLRQENEVFQKSRSEMIANPYEALKRMGMTDKQLAEAALQGNSPEKLVFQLQQQLENERNERIKFQNQIAQEKQAYTVKEAETKLVTVAQNEKVYPNLSQQPPDVIINMAHVTLRKLSNIINPETGLPIDTTRLTYDDIAFALESLYADHSKKRKSARPKEESSNSQENSAPEKKPAPATKTLTNKLAQQKSRLDISEDDLLKLPEREQRKILAERMEAAMRK